jgi:CubicO group peptidase (beta-lactamase class C family)
MKDTFFYGTADRQGRVPIVYERAPEGMKIAVDPDRQRRATYFSGGGGLLGTAEDYVQFAQMLLNGGQLNGMRLLGPRTVELMRSVHVPDTLAGRPAGRAFGLSVQIVDNPLAAGQSVSPGSYGWDGAYGTHFWIDPKEQLVGILMVQTASPNRQTDRDFETAVMQAIIE